MKLLKLVALWILVIFAYIIMATVMPAHNELAASAAVSINETVNSTPEIVGVLEFVESSPIWIWFIPAIVGFVLTVLVIKENDDPIIPRFG